MFKLYRLWVLFYLEYQLFYIIVRNKNLLLQGFGLRCSFHFWMPWLSYPRRHYRNLQDIFIDFFTDFQFYQPWNQNNFGHCAQLNSGLWLLFICLTNTVLDLKKKFLRAFVLYKDWKNTFIFRTKTFTYDDKQSPPTP